MEYSFGIRHYVPEQDLTSLSHLLTEIESIDRDGEETSEKYLRSMREWPNFDPDRNVWVAEMNGALVGYGQILPREDGVCSVYVVVHPAQRRRGLGSRLLGLVLARASETDSTALIVYANAHNLASLAYLKHHGFEVAGTSGMMVAPVSDLPHVQLPPGYILRRYPAVGDAGVVVQALNDCYRDMPGHHQNVTSADRYMDYYGQEGIHLLLDENETLIGICSGKPRGRTDERGVSHLLDAPGLVKECSQRGLQRVLTLSVMSWLRERSALPITLEYWGDDEKTLGLYRELGFELINQQISYHRELP